MHKISITNIGCECNCGWHETTVVDMDRKRAAHKHARTNQPSVITDDRSAEEKSARALRTLPEHVSRGDVRPFGKIGQ